MSLTRADIARMGRYTPETIERVKSFVERVDALEALEARVAELEARVAELEPRGKKK